MLTRIIHKAGKGPEHAQDLTREEADEAFTAIVRGEITPLQLGGFLIALRTKGETGLEIAAYARALRSSARPTANGSRPTPAVSEGRQARVEPLSWPCYAGKARTFRAVPAAAILLSRLGVDATLHTYDDPPSPCRHESGSGELSTPVSERCRSAGYGAASAPCRHGTGELLDALGIPHLSVEKFHPRLYALLELRKELGVRSITNVAARLALPADRHFIAISHAPYFEKYQAALEDLGERGVIVMGSEGEPEAPYHGVLKLLRVPGGTETHRPEDYGLRRPRIEEIPAGSVDEEADISRRVLAGEDLPHRTVVVMTAAAALSAAADVPFDEALKCALALISRRSVSTTPR